MTVLMVYSQILMSVQQKHITVHKCVLILLAPSPVPVTVATYCPVMDGFALVCRICCIKYL